MSRIFVNAKARGKGNGSSWNDAYRDLHTALENATPGSEILIAAGIYKPTKTRDRQASFDIPSNVSITGGYTANPRNPEQQSERAVTILSGDIGRRNFANDNSYNVVTIKRANNVSLSNLTITGGNAKDRIHDRGGGILIEKSNNVDLSELKVIGNQAFIGGGINSLSSTNINIDQSEFTNNVATNGEGGGIAIARSSVFKINKSLFRGNVAFGSGGAIDSGFSQMVVEDSKFIRNSTKIIPGDRKVHAYDGGAISTSNKPDKGPKTTIFNNLEFIENISFDDGGAIETDNRSLTFASNLYLSNNDTNGVGGYSSILNERSQFTLVDSIIISNSDQPIYFGNTLESSNLGNKIVNSTFVFKARANKNLFILQGFDQLYNSIVWADGKIQNNQQVIKPSPAASRNPDKSISNNIIAGRKIGNNNLNVDPKFVEDGVELSNISPAIDSGKNRFYVQAFNQKSKFKEASEQIANLINNRRVMGEIIDIGALENFGNNTNNTKAENTKSNPEVFLRNTIVTEGNRGFKIATVPARLSHPSQERILVNYQLRERTASAATDFVGGRARVVFAPGETRGELKVRIKSDKIDEDNEEFQIRPLASNSDVRISSNSFATVTIRDDELKPTITLNDLSVKEGNRGVKIATVPARLSHPSQERIVLNYQLRERTASAATDFVGGRARVVFGPGETRGELKVRIKSDKIDEANEEFQIRPLASNSDVRISSNSFATVTIRDDDPLLSPPRNSFVRTGNNLSNSNNDKINFPMEVASWNKNAWLGSTSNNASIVSESLATSGQRDKTIENWMASDYDNNSSGQTGSELLGI